MSSDELVEFMYIEGITVRERLILMVSVQIVFHHRKNRCSAALLLLLVGLVKLIGKAQCRVYVFAIDHSLFFGQ